MTEVSGYRAPYDRLTASAVAPVERAYNGSERDTGYQEKPKPQVARESLLGNRIDLYA